MKSESAHEDVQLGIAEPSKIHHQDTVTTDASKEEVKTEKTEVDKRKEMTQRLLKTKD